MGRPFIAVWDINLHYFIFVLSLVAMRKTGIYYGHFGHQRVTISESHKPICFLKLPMEHSGNIFFYNFQFFSRPNPEVTV
jgi:hypothetical protein